MAEDIPTLIAQTSEYRRSRQRRGQRQLARPCLAALAILILFLTVNLADAQPSHSPIATVEMPSFPLGVAEADGWIVVSLGLSGVAFVPSPPWGEPPTVTHHPEWQTLSVFDMPGPGFLLSGRDGIVRHLVADPPGTEPVLIAEFPVEGVPNQVVLDGDILVVASGGAGLSLWDWPGRTAEPSLRGRYPFVEFARRIDLDPAGGILYVADSIAGRVAILDISDPMRPRLAESYSVSSFCDSVEVGSKYLVFSDRNSATFVARRAPENSSGNLWLLHQQISLVHPHQEHRDVKRVFLSAQEDTILISEALTGVRHMRLDPNTALFTEAGRYQTNGGAMDAIVTPSGHLVVADNPDRISVFRLADAPERR